jgi:hypothetical protein
MTARWKEKRLPPFEAQGKQKAASTESKKIHRAKTPRNAGEFIAKYMRWGGIDRKGAAGLR